MKTLLAVLAISVLSYIGFAAEDAKPASAKEDIKAAGGATKEALVKTGAATKKAASATGGRALAADSVCRHARR